MESVRIVATVGKQWSSIGPKMFMSPGKTKRGVERPLRSLGVGRRWDGIFFLSECLKRESPFKTTNKITYIEIATF